MAEETELRNIPKFKDLKLIRKIFTYSLIGYLFLEILGILFNNISFADSEGETLAQFNGLSLLPIVLMFVWGISFFVWVHKAAWNKELLGFKKINGKDIISADKSVIYLIIPIVNVFTQYRIFKEIWLASNLVDKDDERYPHRFIFWWFLACLFYLLLIVLIFFAVVAVLSYIVYDVISKGGAQMNEAEIMNAIQDQMLGIAGILFAIVMYIFGYLFFFLLAALTIHTVRKVSKAQEATIAKIEAGEVDFPLKD